MKRFLFLSLIMLVNITCKKDNIEPEDMQEQPVASSSINLLPTIGLFDAPNTADSICPIIYYTSSDFDINALMPGDQAMDFTLYSINNKPFNLSKILEDKKPVFLMTGSYTCPQFRASIFDLNNLIYDLEMKLIFFVVYTVEAHPKIDVSPYSGQLWTTTTNIIEDILYGQPKVYSQRLSIINDMIASTTINCELLIDGPCNEFWYHYGEAPNRAYLIDSTGQIQVSHGWFDYPTMATSIETYLEK